MCCHDRDQNFRRRDVEEGECREGWGRERDQNYCDCENEQDRENETDSLERLKSTLDQFVEEAFRDLVIEKAKEYLKTKMGARLDSVAEAAVDHFLQMREIEMKAALHEEEFDQKIRNSLKPPS